MADLSSLPDPAKPAHAAAPASEQGPSGPDPIDAIGSDPFAAPDTEPEQDPFAAPDVAAATQNVAVSDAAFTQPLRPDRTAQNAAQAPVPPVYTGGAASAYAENNVYDTGARGFGEAYDLPDHLRPLSPWAYFGYTILYEIPVVGLIFLIVHSVSKKNINRRNFARSFWIWLLISVIVIAVCILIGLIPASVYEEPVSEVRSLLGR